VRNPGAGLVPTDPRVVVFGPGPFVSITLEAAVTGADDDEIHIHAAGQGVWVARAAARLGARVTLVTTCGGEHGTVLGPLLTQEPFDVAIAEVSGEGACYVDDRRTRDRTRIATRHADLLSRHELDDLYGAALSTGLGADVAVLCGTGEAERLPADLYRRLATDLRANGTPVVADLSGTFVDAALRGGLDVLKINQSEALEVDDGSSSELADLVGTARRLMERGAERVVLSRADDPAIAVDGEQVFELTAPTLETADHRGAGDSMTAALAVGVGAGEEWTSVLTRATAAGSANVTRHGLGTSWMSEVDALQPRVRVTPLPDA
jgi:1-phosphofructokinase